MTVASENLFPKLLLVNAAAPAAPAAGLVKVYSKVDKKLYHKDDAGLETRLGLDAIADLTILGNNSGGPLTPFALTAAQVRTVLALAAIATSGSASDLGSGTLAAARIASGSLALSKLADIADARLLGNNSGGAGPPLELTAAQVRTLLALAAIATSGSGADLSAGTVANAALANMADQRLKGNVSGGAAAPADLTAAQVKTFLALVAADITNLGANVATWLATPSGANLAAALTSALTIGKGGTGLSTTEGPFGNLGGFLNSHTQNGTTASRYLGSAGAMLIIPKGYKAEVYAISCHTASTLPPAGQTATPKLFQDGSDQSGSFTTDHLISNSSASSLTKPTSAPFVVDATAADVQLNVEQTLTATTGTLTITSSIFGRVYKP